MSSSKDIFQYIRKIENNELRKMQESFSSAWPYPHICIDNFLTPDFAQALIKDFPNEDDPEYKKFCVEDSGKIGTNYANGSPETFSESFKLLDKISSTSQFLEYITALTGIQALEYDPYYHGAGIRESRTNTALPVHIDFNYHPQTLTHRRLNLLLYLNEEWQADWGGEIQVHLDPKAYKEKSLVNSYPPIFNRCFLFETSEISWHGFSKLNIPQKKSRRAWSIYFYTKDRPNAANIKLHNTEYVEPPLPEYFCAGYTLTEADMKLLRESLERRDERIELLYRIRAGMDDKYAHLWHEYEYYLAKCKTVENKMPTTLFGRLKNYMKTT